MALNTDDPRFQVGARVRFKPDAWLTISNYDVCLSGCTGTVLENKAVGRHGYLVVKLDQPLKALEEWDNESHFGPDVEDQAHYLEITELLP